MKSFLSACCSSRISEGILWKHTTWGSLIIPSCLLLCSKLQPLASLYRMNCVNEADSMCQAGLRNIYCTVSCKHSWLHIEKSCQVRCRQYLSHLGEPQRQFAWRHLRLCNRKVPLSFNMSTSWCEFLTPNMKTFQNELHRLIINGVFLLWLVVFLSEWLYLADERAFLSIRLQYCILNSFIHVKAEWSAVGCPEHH